MTQQQVSGSGSAFERSGVVASAIVAVAVVWTALQWLTLLATPSAARAYRNAVPDPLLDAQIFTIYDFLQTVLSLIGITTFVLTGIWLARARRNAERIAPGQQRRSAIWVWLGWVVPLVSLWFPKQVVDDVWRATVRQPGPPGQVGTAVPVAPHTGWWWGSWITAQVFSALSAQTFGIAGQPRTQFLEYLVPLELLTSVATTVAALQWISVVRTVSRAQDVLAGTTPSGEWEQLGPSREDGYPG